MNNDMHNHWNIKDSPLSRTEVVLNVSLEEISIVIDDKVAFKHIGGVTKNDAQLIKFIAEGIAQRFNSVLVVNEIKEKLN